MAHVQRVAEAGVGIHQQRQLDGIADAARCLGDLGQAHEGHVRQAELHVGHAGADGIQLEDQVSPKRCGHFDGKDVIGTDEMVGKIKAAVDARQDADLVIMARTDARAVHGFSAAIDRAHAYAEAGADILFIEACTSADEIRALPRDLPQRPLLMNMVIGGKTPIVHADELATLGYGLVLYANAALQGALLGMQRALASLKETRQLTEGSGLVAPFKERQRIVRMPQMDELAKRFV